MQEENHEKTHGKSRFGTGMSAGLVGRNGDGSGGLPSTPLYQGKSGEIRLFLHR
jgi:hypothetical protein